MQRRRGSCPGRPRFGRGGGRGGGKGGGPDFGGQTESIEELFVLALGSFVFGRRGEENKKKGRRKNEKLKDDTNDGSKEEGNRSRNGKLKVERR